MTRLEQTEVCEACGRPYLIASGHNCPGPRSSRTCSPEEALMTTETYAFDHYMGDGYTVTREVTLTVRRGGVAERRYGKTTFYRARFPRLLAWQMARQLKREGYDRVPDALYARWKRETAPRGSYLPFGQWAKAA